MLEVEVPLDIPDLITNVTQLRILSYKMMTKILKKKVTLLI